MHSELVAMKVEKNKEQQSSTQAAATLAATNAARQAEMEMQIERMKKEIDTKKREIDTIKSQLQEKDQATARLNAELQDARNDMVHFKEQVESEKEKQALQRIAKREYFDDEMSVTSEHTFNSSSKRGLFSRFSRSKANVDESDNNLDWDGGKEREKDVRIEQLENTITENALVISNLKNELVMASSKFNKDESQRRMLIQRLENENQAYSIKLEVLENEFNELKKKRNEPSKFGESLDQMNKSSRSNYNQSFGQSFFTAASDNSVDSGSTSSMSGMSAISGASRLTPLERDNKKLKKQKKLYENRISSLQTQLSEIQQIVPELMSKSKSQISKLEHSIQTQKHAAEEREKGLQEGKLLMCLCVFESYTMIVCVYSISLLYCTSEITELKRQNEQLQAATRSRLQASDAERQDEIDHLKMRLEAREATIVKLEMLASTGGKSHSVKKKGGILKKKKKKTNAGDEISVLSGVSSFGGGDK